MAARGTGGDVAAVEDVQVEAQVGQVEVHRQPIDMCRLKGPLRGQARSHKGMRETCRGGLAREGVSSHNENTSLRQSKRHTQYMTDFQPANPGSP
ncbi:hypothetical protein PMHK_39540 [Pseudomonas sp. MHK4]